MFEKKTVFIIGAGCSKEFDLPLGWELRDEIFSLCGGRTSILRDAFLRSGVEQANINTEQKIKDFAGGLHTKSSIDQYLNFHQGNATVEALGKISIAQIILSKEKQSKLRRGVGLDLIGETWFMKLFRRMNDGTTLADVENLFQNVSFICFNYDRCIEVAMFRAVRGLTQASPEKVAEIVSDNLRIWHPYGTVGDIDFRNEVRGRSDLIAGFGGRLGEFGHEFIAPSRNLRTFTEGLDDDDIRSAMQEEITNAQQIVYLGFSFIDQNMKLLTVRSANPHGKIYATTCGMKAPDVERATVSMCYSAPVVGVPFGERRGAVKLFDGEASKFMDYWGDTLRR